MRDSGKIAIGLILFVILMTFPIWYNLVIGVTEVPDPVIATKNVPGKDQCVRPVEYMKPMHMDLLNQWRDDAVRKGHRVYVAADGRKFNMSLSNTCLDCHNNKEEFCDRCHNAMAVKPYCWDCHNEPEKQTITAQQGGAR